MNRHGIDVRSSIGAILLGVVFVLAVGGLALLSKGWW